MSARATLLNFAKRAAKAPVRVTRRNMSGGGTIEEERGACATRGPALTAGRSRSFISDILGFRAGSVTRGRSRVGRARPSTLRSRRGCLNAGSRGGRMDDTVAVARRAREPQDAPSMFLRPTLTGRPPVTKTTRSWWRPTALPLFPISVSCIASKFGMRLFLLPMEAKVHLIHSYRNEKGRPMAALLFASYSWMLLTNNNWFSVCSAFFTDYYQIRSFSKSLCWDTQRIA